ncbi:MAG: hypothetical protein Q4F99_03940, partial [bacterium]|nr:hypothetical protein [bacterium]
SNIGCNFAGEAPTVGFIPGEAAKGDLMAHEALQSKILQELKKTLKPELLNRFDATIVFHTLDKDAMKQILTIELDAVQKRLESYNATIELTPEALDLIINEGFKQEQGARPLRRAVEHFVEDPLADTLLQEGSLEGVYLLQPRETLPSGEKTLIAQRMPSKTSTRATSNSRKRKVTTTRKTPKRALKARKTNASQPAF